jgi:hypothetical protein
MNTNVPFRPAQLAAARTRSSSRLNWGVLALWLFVALCYAALLFAGCLIWAKCQNP